MSASSNPFTVAGGVVLVTGSAMGTGRLYALRAAREGAAVVLDKFTGRTGTDAGSNTAAGTAKQSGTR